MLNANEVYKAPAILKWYQLTCLLLVAILLSLPFAIFGGFSTALRLFLFFVVLPLWILLIFKYRAISYYFDDSKITISSGIISKQSNNIPYSNVQNVKIKTGPLLSSFGLAKINIWTASQGQISNRGNTDSDGRLIIKREDAQVLEEIILKKK